MHEKIKAAAKLSIPIILLSVAFCGEDHKAQRANIGMCAVNATNGLPRGRIVGVEINPGFGVYCYVLQSFDDLDRTYYAPFENTEPIDCTAYLEISLNIVELTHQCVYNPSDLKYIGKVVRVEKAEMDILGNKEKGSYVLAVKQPDGTEINVTYPRFAKLEICK